MSDPGHRQQRLQRVDRAELVEVDLDAGEIVLWVELFICTDDASEEHDSSLFPWAVLISSGASKSLQGGRKRSSPVADLECGQESRENPSDCFTRIDLEAGEPILRTELATRAAR